MASAARLKSTQTTIPCRQCNGGRWCTVCFGGIRRRACGSCGRSGRCQLCGGTGKETVRPPRRRGDRIIRIVAA